MSKFIKNWREVEYEGETFLIIVQVTNEGVLVQTQVQVGELGAIDHNWTFELADEDITAEFIINDLIGTGYELESFKEAFDTILSVVEGVTG